MSNYYNRQWRLPNNENKNKQSNYSLSFDGSSQYIDAGNNSIFNLQGSFSVSLWVNSTSFQNYVHLLSKEDTSYTGWRIQLDQNNVRIQTSNMSSGITVAKNMNTATWYHMCFTYDGTYLNYYQNGSNAISNNTSFTSPPSSNNNNFRIGKSVLTDAGGAAHNGQIDGVAIFNYALSSSQVTTLYGSSSTGIGNPMSLSPKPVAYYPLGDQDAFNNSSYLTPNASLKDFVFDFNGTTSSAKYVSLTTTILPSGNSPFTMSVWLNRDTNVPSYGGVLSFGDIGSTNSLSMAYINFNTTNQIKYGFYGGDAGTTSIDENVWHHVVLTYDGTNASFYINKQYITSSQPGTLLIPSTSVVKIGGLNTSSQNFDGKLSNAQIFNTALPATGSNSVETLYNNGSPLTSMSGFTSLVGWWKLDASATYDGSNWTIEDSSSNSNDGTSSGMTQSALQQSDLSFKTSYSPFALDFDIDNKISITTSVSTFTAYSVSVWINVDALPSPYGWSRIFEFHNQRYFGLHSDGTLVVGYKNGSWTENFTTATLNTSQWYHLSFVDNGTNTVVYINGVGETLNNTSSAINDNWYIANNATTRLNAKLSNVSVWNTALTASQVTEIYNEGVPSNLNNHSAYSNLVSWWQLGSNSSFNTNWTVLDEKGSNDGTSVNMSENAIVDGVGSYANGLSSGMGGDEVIGDAPYSTANALSVNMDVLDRTTDVPS